VKIGLKPQSLGKISNNSTADPPVLLGQFQHWPKVEVLDIIFSRVTHTIPIVLLYVCPA